MNYGISVLDCGPTDLADAGNLSPDELRHFSRLIMMGQLSACFAHEVTNPLMNLQRIFDPFFTTKGDRGTGLGLYITKQVIEEHRGTSFVISLPL